MTCEAVALPRALRGCWLFLVVLFFVLFVIIIIFIFFFFGKVILALVVFFLFVVFRDDVHVHRVRLRHFHLRFTLRATQDFSLFHFVFIHIEFGSTIRAADHGHFLRSEIPRVGRLAPSRPHHSAYYIPCRGQSNPAPDLLLPSVARSSLSLNNAFSSRIPGTPHRRCRRRPYRKW